jgi:hypothetical protein
VTFSLMYMQKSRQKIEEIFEGGRYARAEEELYEKALALLDKCKIEPSRPDHESAESEPAVNDS